MQQPFGPGSEPRLVALEPSFLAVDKPCGLHSASSGRGSPSSLASWVFERYPETGPALLAGREAEFSRPPEEGGLIHRLDYETSGLVLFARSAVALRHFLAEQEAGRLAKTYRAQCRGSRAGLPGSRPLLGSPAGLGEGLWRAALDEAVETERFEELGVLLEKRRIESRFRPFGPAGARVACLALDTVDPRPRRRGSPGRSYETMVLGSRAEGGGLALELRILRGFRHQIRAHFAWIGLPLLGDNLYGGAEEERLFLHAERLEFIRPETGLPCIIECPA